MTDREVMQKALDVVQRYSKETPLGNQPHMIAQVAYECIEALRTALAKPSWEPVAWMNGYKAGYAQAQETDLAIPQKEPVIDKSMAKRIATQLGWEPKKEWVNLTVEERETLRDAYQDSFSGLISAVQMLLKEKNT